MSFQENMFMTAEEKMSTVNPKDTAETHDWLASNPQDKPLSNPQTSDAPDASVSQPDTLSRFQDYDEVSLSSSEKVTNSHPEVSSSPSFGSIDRKDRSVAWYKADILPIPYAFRQLLESYSGIAPADVEKHVIAIREKAWDMFPYPCIGLGFFLRLDMSAHPVYPLVLGLLISRGVKLIDVGCGFGQELRKLIHDGAPADQLFGIDVAPNMVSMGDELFQDKKRPAARSGKGIGGPTIIISDLKDSHQGFIDQQRSLGSHKASIAYCGKFFHLYNWADQVALCVSLLKHLQTTPPENKHTLIFGDQLGVERDDDAGEQLVGFKGSAKAYIHSAATLAKLWEEVGRETETKWTLDEVEFEDAGPAGFFDDGAWGRGEGRLMRWCVRLVPGL